MINEDVRKILKKHGREKGSMISVFRDVQAIYGYLPREHLQAIAAETGCPLTDLFGVASFYKSFSLTPRGKHVISVCSGTACHVHGSPRIVREFERQLHIKAGETTDDLEFTLETVNCLGACALGPVAVIDGHYFPFVEAGHVRGILDKVREGLDMAAGASGDQVIPLVVRCPRCNHTLMDPDHPINDLPSIKITLSFERIHGSLRLSSLYGSYDIVLEPEVPMDVIANIFCPHCHGELTSPADCPDCGAPMISMIVEAGGIVQICSRRGCKGHMLDLTGVNL